MIILWLLLIIGVTIIAKWVINHNHKDHATIVNYCVLIIFCLIQFVLVYFLVGDIIELLVKGLNVFYH
jgi:heme/copper-type cytochrome/quinol oxidase subunit 4